MSQEANGVPTPECTGGTYTQETRVLLTVTQVGLRVEHAANNEGTNVSASRLNRLPSLQYDYRQTGLGQLQRCKQPCRPTA